MIIIFSGFAGGTGLVPAGDKLLPGSSLTWYKPYLGSIAFVDVSRFGQGIIR